MAVMNAFRVQNLIDGGNDSGSGISQLNAARTFARDNNIRYAAIRDNTITTTNGLIPFPELMNSSQVDLRILDGSRGCDNQNNDSIIVLVRFRQASFLFTGDAELEGGSDCDGEVPILMDFYRNTNLLNVDVYKVGHHASFNGTDEDFMRVMTPKISVISAGIHTQHGPGGFHAFQFGHPRTVTVDLLERFSSMQRPPVNVYSMPKVRRVVPRVMRRAVYCTCWDGDIRVFTSNANGSQLRVQTSGRPDGNAPSNQQRCSSRGWERSALIYLYFFPTVANATSIGRPNLMKKETLMQMPTRYLAFVLTILSTVSLASFSTHQLLPSAQASTLSLSTQERNETVAAVVKAQKANLRDRPSKSGSVVRTVNKGDLLALIAPIPTGPWYRVRDSKTDSLGWVHGNTIVLLQTAESNSAPIRPTQRSRPPLPPVSGRSYVNVDGVRVPSPVFSETKPAGATARCRDGSYSFSQHRRGTCSYHGGVAEWF